ncbi:MAG: ABC transporter permease [Fimbriimonadaceae bacterium]|nr:ABC transporter permease [Fimbriimonadaceae bacterium]QYK59699.1 MAG: ABC transporter permease [Fimbriimonadaceae bacterium]
MDLSFLVQLLRFGAPVGLASLGESVGQKSGLINIGLEGQMLAGAYAGVLASLATGSPYIGLLAGVGASLGLGLLQGLFVIRLALDQVVVGTSVNLVALGATSTLFRAQFGSSGQLLSVPALPRFGPGLDLVVLAVVPLVALVAWVMARTKFGLVLRACGEYPSAAEAAGFSAQRVRWLAAVIGGLFAGLAGAYLSIGVAGSFAESMTAGRGFVAIAMVTFGRWRPWGVFAASVLVGGLEALQFEFQARGVGLPHQALIALPYVVALVVLVVVGKGGGAPAALGQPYERAR